MKLSVLLIYLFLKYVSSSFCYWNSGCPYKYFSDKTPYNNVRGDIRDSVVKLKGCQPVSIWSLFGTPKSTPENEPQKILNESMAIKERVIASFLSGESSLCAQDVENLKNWKVYNNMLSKPNFLTEEGVKELMGIANRLQEAFPSLLRNLKNGDYKLTSASEELMKASAEVFVKGFETRLAVETRGENIVPYKSCGNYKRLQQNSSLHNEVRKYEKSADYLATKDRMQRRLGIENMSDAGIKSLYDLCRFPWSGIENKFSPWCALFTTEDLRVLEYVGDLQHYYQSGYGSPINSILGRFPLADLYEKFRTAKEEKGSTLVAYFTDTSSMNMVCTALNLFKDDSALSGTKRNPKRKWRTSKLSVYSANIIAVLNRCEQEHEVDHNVVFYLNEEPLHTICERGFCSWNEFEDKLSPFLNTTLEVCK